MRIMPFATATSDSVSISGPRMVIRDEEYSRGAVALDWDSLTSVTVECEVVVRPDRFGEQTGVVIDPDADPPLSAALRVDCRATGHRAFAHVPLDREHGAVCRVELPGREIAEELESVVFVVLNRELPPDPTRARARVAGDRLFESSGHRIRLGDDTGFPTEAFAFSEVAGLPDGAPWYLDFNPSLEDPYVSSVRLLINTDHPRSEDILSGAPWTQSVLYHDVLSQMLHQVAAADTADRASTEVHPEGSVGHALELLTQATLGQSLHTALDWLASEPGYMEARIKQGTGFLVRGRSS